MIKDSKNKCHSNTNTAPKFVSKPSNNYYHVLRDYSDGEEDEDKTPLIVHKETHPSFQPQYDVKPLTKAQKKARHRRNVKRRQRRKRTQRNWNLARALVAHDQPNPELCFVTHDPVKLELCFGESNAKFGRSTWLGDTAASTHMGNSQEGMTDIEEVVQYIMIGNGKKLQVNKIGTLHRTVFQEDGTSMDIELKGYKYVPQLQVNLFSITKALDQGWDLSNKGVIMILTKGKASLTFDKIFKTDTGKVVGIELLSRLEESPKDEVAFSE
jgi:hypothetical protein